MSKILITGSEGFIGKHLRKRLEFFEGFDIINGQDVRNKFQVDKVFRENNFETVIHLAARTGVRTGERYPEEYISTNILGTKNLIDASIENGVKNFIFFSSSSVYGTTQPPNKEDQPMNPDSTYGITKMAGETLLKSASSHFNSAIVVRPFTVYGEYGRKDQVIYKWLNQFFNDKPISFFGDGKTKRGYTYVGDLLDGVEKIIQKIESNKLKGFEVFNLGGQEVINLQELFNVFSKTFGQIKIDRLELPEGDVKENYADISKAKEILDFNPNTDFKEKVKNIINLTILEYEG